MTDSRTKDAILSITGGLLVMFGICYFLATSLNAFWLLFLPVPAAAGLCFFNGVRLAEWGWYIPGGITLGGSLGAGAAALSDALPLVSIFGLATAGVGLGFWIAGLVIWLTAKKSPWWALFTGAVILSAAAALLFSPLGLLDFGLYILTGTGLAFIAWGLAEKIFGLIIPGCILVGIGPGIWLAWHDLSQINGLTETGIMLVVFAFGWLLITPLGWVVTRRFTWWNLIPAGILAMTGWGLYIGGDPDNALRFIGNTGSVALLIFGLYLLLWRSGMRR